MDAEYFDGVPRRIRVSGKDLVGERGDVVHVRHSGCGTDAAAEAHKDQSRSVEIAVVTFGGAEECRVDVVREDGSGSHRRVVGDR